jgi:hypothetical protein
VISGATLGPAIPAEEEEEEEEEDRPDHRAGKPG